MLQTQYLCEVQRFPKNGNELKKTVTRVTEAIMEERIKAIYNDCAKNFNKYLSDHDLAGYNHRSQELVIKYGRQSDIIDLLMWFAPRVNKLHESQA